MTDANRTGFWGDQLEAVFTEIVRHARGCDVDLAAPGAVEAVLRDQPAACGSTHPEAFRKMREMLMLAFVVREKAFDQLGALEADALVRHISETLKARLR
jgi:hypothetical protein